MKEIIKIAWRNIWRNKRRTLITAASIFFAVFFAIIMRGFQLGSYDYWINTAVESYSGHLQLQHPDFYDEPMLENSFNYDQKLIDDIKDIKNIKAVTPRLLSMALASSGDQTKVVMINGIVPNVEDKATKLKTKLVKYRLTPKALKDIKNDGASDKAIKKLKKFENYSYSSTGKIELDMMLNGKVKDEILGLMDKHATYTGEYLTNHDEGVLVADKLSKFLKLEPGDTIVLIGQGYRGTSAAGKYPIRGIIKIPNPQMDRMMIFMPLKLSQEFYSMYEIADNGTDTLYKLNAIALNTNGRKEKQLKDTRAEIKKLVSSDNIRVRDWKELNTELVQQIESDNISGKIFLGILYLIIGFGVFGTVLMMTLERKREFGVMIAVGMQRLKLGVIILYEMVFISLLGVISGMIASIPMVLYGHYNPIRITGDTAKMYEEMGFDPVMPFAFIDTYFLNQGVIVLIMVFLATIYPIITISKLNVIKSIRGR